MDGYDFVWRAYVGSASAGWSLFSDFTLHRDPLPVFLARVLAMVTPDSIVVELGRVLSQSRSGSGCLDVVVLWSGAALPASFFVIDAVCPGVDHDMPF